MSNMERFETSKNYWSEIFEPQTRVERHLTTLIAFQDLLMQRSMTEALSARDERKAMSGERRQNDLILSIDRLVQVMTTVQSRRKATNAPPDAPTNVIEMPKPSKPAKSHAGPITELKTDQAPSLFPFGSPRATEPRRRGVRFALDLIHDQVA